MVSVEVNARVVVVDDDEELRRLIEDYLSRSRIRVAGLPDGSALVSCLQQEPADVVVLDVMLPGEDGLSLCKRLRDTPGLESVGIIMLTARDSTLDRVMGLELGADDYLSKPFEPVELLARIKALLRRSQNRAAGDPQAALNDGVQRFEGWAFDTRSRQLRSPGGVLISLPNSDSRILECLLQRPNQPVSRDELMNVAFGRERMPLDRSVDVCVSRLRTALEKHGASGRLIHTIRNEGYMYCAPDSIGRPAPGAP